MDRMERGLSDYRRRELLRQEDPAKNRDVAHVQAKLREDPWERGEQKPGGYRSAEDVCSAERPLRPNALAGDREERQR